MSGISEKEPPKGTSLEPDSENSFGVERDSFSPLRVGGGGGGKVLRGLLGGRARI